MVERQMDLPNLKHFMLSNRVYGSTSNTVLPGRGHNDYAALAQGFGIEHVSAFDTLDGLEAGFDAAVMQPGHAFVVLEVEPYAYGKASPPMPTARRHRPWTDPRSSSISAAISSAPPANKSSPAPPGISFREAEGKGGGAGA